MGTLSTKVNEIEVGLEGKDEFGVSYSRDGKRPYVKCLVCVSFVIL